jgi:hypothetical protein
LRRDFAVDVDLQAVRVLEHQMFAIAKGAAEKGNFQWGLNSGPHRDAWDPYLAYKKTIENGEPYTIKRRKVRTDFLTVFSNS